MPRSERLMDLVNFISRRPRSLGDITARLSISERTAYRDIASLSNIAPVTREDAGYRLLSTGTLRPLNLTPEEHAVLKLALQNPALRRTPTLRRRLDLLEAKLDAAMAHLEETPTALRLAGPTLSGPAAGSALEALEKAVHQRRRVEIVYTSLHGPSRLNGGETSKSPARERARAAKRHPKPERRALDPWQVFERAGAWYVVGYCHKNASPRIFRLDRIVQVAAVFPPPATFEIPRDFDLDGYLADAWTVFVGGETHDITLHFAPALAPLILNAEHHAGETKRVIAGGKVEYRVRLSSLEEIARWVVGFGGGVRVIGPTDLTSLIRGLAGGAMKAASRG